MRAASFCSPAKALHVLFIGGKVRDSRIHNAAQVLHPVMKTQFLRLRFLSEVLRQRVEIFCFSRRGSAFTADSISANLFIQARLAHTYKNPQANKRDAHRFLQRSVGEKICVYLRNLRTKKPPRPPEKRPSRVNKPASRPTKSPGRTTNPLRHPPKRPGCLCKSRRRTEKRPRRV